MLSDSIKAKKVTKPVHKQVWDTPEAASFVLHDCLDVTDPTTFIQAVTPKQQWRTGALRAYMTNEEDLLNSAAGMTKIDLFYVHYEFFICINITIHRQLRRIFYFTTLVSYMLPLDVWIYLGLNITSIHPTNHPSIHPSIHQISISVLNIRVRAPYTG